MCGFKKQKKALTFYSQSLICHCDALVLLSFIILPYKTSALPDGVFGLHKQMPVSNSVFYLVCVFFWKSL